ncbi:MAG: ComEA family DNA-binding protein [Ketobacter sp.]|nr:ComEA family DNA-binding protein [Ketobacter sp.]
MRILPILLMLFALCCGWPGAAFSGDKQQYFIPLPININSADELTLSRALVGVGPKKAAAIVAYRQQNGPFQSPAELAGVKGIGKGTLARNKGRISVE